MVDFKKLMEDKKAGIERSKMMQDDIDHTPLTFGKYKGQTPDAVSETDPGYIVWLYDNVTNKPTCSKLLRDACVSDTKTNRWRNANKPDETAPLDPLNDIDF